MNVIIEIDITINNFFIHSSCVSTQYFRPQWSYYIICCTSKQCSSISILSTYTYTVILKLPNTKLSVFLTRLFVDHQTCWYNFFGVNRFILGVFALFLSIINYFEHQPNNIICIDPGFETSCQLTPLPLMTNFCIYLH